MESEQMTKYSVIILFEEMNAGFSDFLQALNNVFSSRQETFEIIIVANGTGEFLRGELEKLGGYNGALRAFELNEKTSQAVRLRAGFEESRGEIILICGSQQQLTQESISKALDSLDGSTDIVNPWRQQRLDPAFNQFQSRIYNCLVRKLTKSGLHDLSCPIKIVRREVLKHTELYGNMYGFMPVLAEQKGFRTKEIECAHHEQVRGEVGLYHLSLYVERMIDLFALYFVTRFNKKPLRFFSLFGTLMLIMGFIIYCYISVEKILLGHPIGERPLLLIGVFLTVLGIQVASMGLLGEIIAFAHGRHKPQYTIEKSI